MRLRTILLVVAILLVAGFAALNWAEIVRPAPLLFGPVVMDAPMGAILLGLLALTLIAFLLFAASMRTHALMEARQHHKMLEQQRELADKAEASRFTELRQHLDHELRQLRERDAIVIGEMEKAHLNHQRELRTQLEQINRTIAARLGELEHRLDQRLGHGGTAALPPVHHGAPPVLSVPARSEAVHPAQVAAEHGTASEEQRLREERLRTEQHAAAADRAQQARREDKPVAGEQPSGWRRWF